MKINEIELYNEDIMDDILSHLGSKDKVELEEILKSLCSMVTIKDKDIVDLREKISNIGVVLEQLSTVYKAPTHLEKEEEEDKKMEEYRAELKRRELYGEQLCSCRIVEWVD